MTTLSVIERFKNSPPGTYGKEFLKKLYGKK